jgi:hypothetical protein
MDGFSFIDTPSLLQLDLKYFPPGTASEARVEEHYTDEGLVPIMFLGSTEQFPNKYDIDYGEFKDQQCIDMFDAMVHGNLEVMIKKCLEVVEFDCPLPTIGTSRDEVGDHCSELEHGLFSSTLINRPLVLVNPSFGTLSRAEAQNCDFSVAVIRRPDYAHEGTLDILNDFARVALRPVNHVMYNSYSDMFKATPGKLKYLGFSFEDHWDRMSLGFQVVPTNEYFLAAMARTVEEDDMVVRTSYLRGVHLGYAEIRKRVDHYRYTYDTYVGAFPPKTQRRPFSPVNGAFSLCCGRRVIFCNAVVPTVMPNTVGAIIYPDVGIVEYEKNKYCVNRAGEVLDGDVSEDVGSRRNLPFRLDPPLEYGSVLVSPSHRGFYFEPGIADSYTRTACVPTSYYVGKRRQESHTFVPFAMTYSTVSEYERILSELGCKFDYSQPDGSYFFQVSARANAEFQKIFPLLNASYDGENRLFVPRGKLKEPPFGCSVREVSVGWEYKGQIGDLDWRLRDYGRFIPGVDIKRVKPSGWVPDLIAVYGTFGATKNIHILNEEDYYGGDKILEIFSRGGRLKAQTQDIPSGHIRSVDGKKCLLVEGHIGVLGTHNVVWAFGALARSRARCYRHADFDAELGQMYSSMEVLEV